jgi:hypothetical protein
LEVLGTECILSRWLPGAASHARWEADDVFSPNRTGEAEIAHPGRIVPGVIIVTIPKKPEVMPKKIAVKVQE